MQQTAFAFIFVCGVVFGSLKAEAPFYTTFYNQIHRLQGQFPGEYYYQSRTAPAPATGAPIPYNTETISTPYLAKSEIRDDAGQYTLSYYTANGIHVTERGYLKPNGEGDFVLAKEGTYSYTSPEGVPVYFGYTADENGFITKGYPLPIAPPKAPTPINY